MSTNPQSDFDRHPNPQARAQVPAPVPPPMVHAAKWPPDDSALPGNPYVGGGGGASDDGNFKRGAVKPIALVVGAALVIGAGIIAALGMKTEGEKMSKEDIGKEKKSIALLPMAEQLPKWRKWAGQSGEIHLQQEAFAHLAWEKDREGLDSIVKGLSSDDHGVRGTAASALLEYGSPMADSAKAPLMKALGEAQANDKPQICWALATLHESAAFDPCMAEYRLGHLTKVQRVDGSPAFDPEELASMVSLDKLASLVGDESDSVRQLVATTLSRTGDAKWTDSLVRLVKDKQIEVAREAAVGLGKIANEQTMAPLLDALSRADKESRQKFLEAIRDGVGGKGLVLALKSVSTAKPESEKFQTKQIFDMLRDLSDPRASDSLYAYAQSNPKPHWKTEAGMRMAEIGDPRASEILGWRMGQDTLKLYNDIDWPELRRDDNERVVGARYLADLAVIHPQAREMLRKNAEHGVFAWIESKPYPHANGLRFLVASQSSAIVPKLKAWADPSLPLPKEGQQPPFPEEWATAQSALRYLGWSKDPGAWGILTKQLTRRPVKVNASWESLYQGGLTLLGMTLVALEVGSSHGLAQWGDSKAYPLLTKIIEEPFENERSRIEGCFALSWVATDDQMKEVVAKIRAANKGDKNSTYLRTCYLETLVHRPVPSAAAGLVEMLGPSEPDVEARHQVARAIGMAGITPAMLPQIFERLKDVNTKADAALALLLGGDTDSAMRAIASYNDDKPEAMIELRDIYNKTFSYWSDKNYENGDIARWVANAQAISRVKVNDAFQDWAKMILSRNLIDSIEIENGPHSMTRTQFRFRLFNDAKSADEKKRTGAIQILKFMKERGVLMALRQEPAPVGEMARRAFFEVMNPKLTAEAIPEAPKRGTDVTPNFPGANVVPK